MSKDEFPPDEFLDFIKKKRPDLRIEGQEMADNLFKKSTVEVDTVRYEKPQDFPWKYSEGKILSELEKYLRGTYGEHYVSGGPQGVQEFDVMEADGELGVFSKQSARKYLRRYGRKDGCNRKDLLKVLHYTIILMYLNEKEAK